MNEHDWLAQRFEENRSHLRAVAYRMLGSLHEAEDAVQEAWLRVVRADPDTIENLGGWLTTVVARICLDALRSRNLRREDSLEMNLAEPATRETGNDPEQEILLANSVGLALLVVLDTLTPAERLAFVLHDIFAAPFEEIATITGRTVTAARQLASRARRRVHGTGTIPNADVDRQRRVVDAFLSAARAGDFEALLSILDPNVVLRNDPIALPAGAPREVRGAEALAKRAISGGARAAQPALVNGAVGVVVAPRGRLFMVLRFTISEGKVVEIDAVADPDHLTRLEIAVLNG